MPGPHEVPGPDEAVAGVVVGVDMREDGVGGGVSGDHDQCYGVRLGRVGMARVWV